MVRINLEKSIDKGQLHIGQILVNPNQYLTDTCTSIKKKQLYGPFLWMGFNCLKATATSRRQFKRPTLSLGDNKGRKTNTHNNTSDNPIFIYIQLIWNSIFWQVVEKVKKYRHGKMPFIPHITHFWWAYPQNS